MKQDRTAICKIISEMLDNPDKHGIYPTSTAYTRLEHYIEAQRHLAIGWTHAWACVSLGRGDDPRIEEVPVMLAQARKDLEEAP